VKEKVVKTTKPNVPSIIVNEVEHEMIAQQTRRQETPTPPQ